MRRLRAAKNEVALSLFPFLAVLICTMGALIVLLVVVVRNAKVQAEEVAAVDQDQRAAERQLREEDLAEQQRLREDHLWRLEILAAQREEMTKQLDRRRLELSHLEEHHRRLREKMDQALQQAASFDELDAATQQDQQAIATQLSQLRTEIAQAEKELAQAQQKMKAAQQGYALLPYDGPQGTKRRPIYVECTQQAVIIQPEGIKLSPRDFSGPLGAGNPLDAALRASREYMASAGLLNQGEEPYPLLVVRPGGSISYAAARAAMTSWDNEFGYELIDDEMKLAYGGSDPERAKAITRAVEEARQRTDVLRSAAPARFEGNEILSFTEQRSDYGEGGGVGLTRGSRGGRDSGGTTRGGIARGGSATRAGNSFSGGYGRPGTGQSRGFSGDRAYPAGNDSQAGGGRSGQSSQTNGAYASQSNPSGQGGGASTPGRESMGSPGQASGQQGNSAGSASQQSASQEGQPQFPQQRIANTRGANWAVEGASPGATGYNRPISMTCYADRIEIPAAGESPMQTIAFLGNTGNAVGMLVEGVTRRVDSWGIAGRGAYWKPVLRIDVQPGAERRFEELQVLLDRSGLILERK